MVDRISIIDIDISIDIDQEEGIPNAEFFKVSGEFGMAVKQYTIISVNTSDRPS